MKPTPDDSMSTVREALRDGRALLCDSGTDTYNLDAGLILSHVTGLTKTELFTKDDRLLSEEQLTQYRVLLNKRAEGTPLPYITGHVEFMGLDFYVDQNVLIPRGDTEILTEAAIAAIRARGYTKVLDMCAGSGCIGVSIARYCPQAQVFAVDSMSAALDVTERNALRHGVASRVRRIQSDMFTSLGETGFDVLVSNPPYIRRGEIPMLDRNVKEYEPLVSLDGGPDGLDFYHVIAASLRGFLTPGGRIFLEIGYDQAAAVAGILEPYVGKQIEIRTDLAGRDRVVEAVLEPEKYRRPEGKGVLHV